MKGLMLVTLLNAPNDSHIAEDAAEEDRAESEKAAEAAEAAEEDPAEAEEAAACDNEEEAPSC